MRVHAELIAALAVLAAMGSGGCDDDAPADAGTHDTATADAVADVGRDIAQDSAGDETGQPDTGADSADTDEDAPDDLVDIAPDTLDDLGDASDASRDTGDADGADTEVADLVDAGPPACAYDFDCALGDVCREGFCAVFEPECTPAEGCDGDWDCLDGICVEPGHSPCAVRIVINEVLIDGSTDEDANGDGSVDALEDAFVELVNVSSGPLDLSDWTLVERHYSTGLPRHTFAAGTSLQPAAAAVVFGGGAPPDDTETIRYFTANAADQGDPYGLDLDVAGGDRLRLLDDEGRIVAEFAYGDMGDLPVVTDESLTRSPDLTGGFVEHSDAAGSDGAVFSPGTRVDGSPFRAPDS